MRCALAQAEGLCHQALQLRWHRHLACAAREAPFEMRPNQPVKDLDLSTVTVAPITSTIRRQLERAVGAIRTRAAERFQAGAGRFLRDLAAR